MKFLEALSRHVLILDGAMGTMVQNLELKDEDFGGPDFKMLTDLLVFSRPFALEEIHFKYKVKNYKTSLKINVNVD